MYLNQMYDDRCTTRLCTCMCMYVWGQYVSQHIRPVGHSGPAWTLFQSIPPCVHWHDFCVICNRVSQLILSIVLPPACCQCFMYAFCQSCSHELAAALFEYRYHHSVSAWIMSVIYNTLDNYWSVSQLLLVFSLHGDAGIHDVLAKWVE
jgi:hypothetical protein